MSTQAQLQQSLEPAKFMATVARTREVRKGAKQPQFSRSKLFPQTSKLKHFSLSSQRLLHAAPFVHSLSLTFLKLPPPWHLQLTTAPLVMIFPQLTVYPTKSQACDSGLRGLAIEWLVSYVEKRPFYDLYKRFNACLPFTSAKDILHIFAHQS